MLLLCPDGLYLVFLVCTQQLLSKHLVGSNYLLPVRCPAFSENINSLSDGYVAHVPPLGSLSLLIVQIILHRHPQPIHFCLCYITYCPGMLTPTNYLSQALMQSSVWNQQWESLAGCWGGEESKVKMTLLCSPLALGNSSGCSYVFTLPAKWTLLQDHGSYEVLVTSLPSSSGPSGP